MKTESGLPWATRALTICLTLLEACGGESKPPGGGAAACPAAPPQGGPKATGGDPCSTEGLECSYGDWPGVCGRKVALCKKGQFYTAIYDCVRNVTCPAQPPPAGMSCSVPQPANACAYGDGSLCICTREAPFDPWGWLCHPGPSDARCPRAMPQLGGSCSPDGVDCDYGVNADGWHLRCAGSIWKRV